ncbi:MAG: DNA polymerase, partial [Candidatus Saccharimonadales bacterium]
WNHRKKFIVSRGQGTDKKSVTIWDIFGYFQRSFVKACQEWSVGQEHLGQIAAMKAKRGEFADESPENIRSYCQSECQILVELFRKLLDCVASVGLKLSAYNGAGSIAEAILRKFDVLSAKDDAPLLERESEIMSAYFGGRFEMRTVGHFERLYNYDINSAYPAALLTVPSLTGARWERGVQGIGLVKVRWKIDETRDLFGPLPVRAKDQSITYPSCGTGWYWSFEADAAREYLREVFAVELEYIDGWELVTISDEKPFEFLRELYVERRRRKLNGDLGHLVLKLGYNSLYGKCAQNVGTMRDPDTGEIKRPRFQSFIWAGWVTAMCRIKILRALTLAPGAVVSIATDGVLSETPISLPISTDIGGWEYGEIDRAFLVRPNMYVGRKKDGALRKTGGFLPDEEQVDRFIPLFERFGQEAFLIVPTNRFLGLEMALQRGLFPDVWRSWLSETRVIRAVQHNRQFSDGESAPFSQLQTRMFDGGSESFPYKLRIGWEDYDRDLDLNYITFSAQP